MLYQYPVDLLAFLELNLKSAKYLTMGKFKLLLASFSKAILSGSKHLKGNKPVYIREMIRNLHSTATIYNYPCSCFHFIVNEISRNKALGFIRNPSGFN